MVDAELDALRSVADGVPLTFEQVAALQEAQWRRAVAMPDDFYPPGSLGAEIQKLDRKMADVADSVREWLLRTEGVEED